MPSPNDTTIFRCTLRVYWEDTDAGGVVFYANYLKFFERARTEWLRALGFEQERLRVAEQTMFVVSETHVHYLQPARLDERLQVSVSLQQRGRASLVVAQRCWRVGDDAAQPTLLAEGTIRIGCVDSGTFKPRRIPTTLLERLA